MQNRQFQDPTRSGGERTMTIEETPPRRYAHWRGFTAMGDFDPIVVTHARGCVLWTDDGRELIDGVSSLWCNVHGHRCDEIDRAMIDQIQRVSHVPSLGLSTDVTETLAAKLVEISPAELNHVFFASDGSSAVEAALKMAFQYCQQTGQSNRTEFLALGHAYHGDTTGSVSLGGIDHFHQLFRPLLFDPIRGPAPCRYRVPDDVDCPLEYYAKVYEDLIERHASRLAAVVLEPLVQGAAGMLTHPAGWLARIRAACDRHAVLLIADEVATGFGRTGRWFACDHEAVGPDILCVGKGLTGGYLPMSATLATSTVYDAFLGPAASNRQFFHGHTFGGNAVAAAAAVASIDRLMDRRLIGDVDRKAGRLRERLRPLDSHPHVGDIRGRGLMFGIELVRDRSNQQSFDSRWRVGHEVCQVAIRRGVWLRPLGDVIVVMPPLVISDEQIDTIGDAVVASVEEVCCRLRRETAELREVT